MRIHLLVANLIGLCALWAAIPPCSAQEVTPPPATEEAAPPQATFSPEEGERWIDFVGLEDHQIVVPVRVNGEPLWALVDTGMPWTVLSKSWVQSHGLALTNPQKTTGVSGLEAPLWQASLKSIDIGGYHQTGGGANVVDLDAINSNLSSGRHIDMVIGLPLLLLLVTDVDFEHARIRFRLTGQPPAGAVLLPVSLSPERLRLFTSLRIGDQVIGPLMIDTGSDGSVTVMRSAIGAYPPAWRVTDVMQAGMGGVYVGDYARLDDVQWGERRFDRVQTNIAPKLAQGSGVGMIGLALLERANLTFDGPKGLMYASPRANPPAEPIVTNMGIQGSVSDEGWLVVHIMRGSPAQSVGLKAGDRICLVDGVRMTAKSAIPRGPDGSVLHLELCDGRKIRLTRQTFY